MHGTASHLQIISNRLGCLIKRSNFRTRFKKFYLSLSHFICISARFVFYNYVVLSWALMPTGIFNKTSFLFQAIWVFTVSLSVIFVNAEASALVHPWWTAMDIVGLVLFCLGLLLEAVSDQQKFSFRNNPENKGKWCDTGIPFVY